jgi:predicted small lipoprotein YifL
MPLRTLIIILLAAAALSGCGRRGSLEAPGEPSPRAGSYGAPPADVSPLDPGSVPATPEQQQLQPPPRRRYFLDFLL